MAPRPPAKPPLPPPALSWRTIRVTWDGAILVAAIVWGTAEILWLGARPSSLTFISGMVLSTGIVRLEERGNR